MKNTDKTEYHYHIFISYSRTEAVAAWVNNYFYPELKKWLPEELPSGEEVHIFIDKENIDTGDKWEDRIKESLKRTRILLPVLTSPYFSSDWCNAELDTFLAREELLYKRNECQLTKGLIYPIVFADGEYFSDAVKKIQHRDMKEWAITAEAFRFSEKFIEFENSVKQITKDIARMLRELPSFNPNWPIIEPKETSRHQVPIPVPRLIL